MHSQRLVQVAVFTVFLIGIVHGEHMKGKSMHDGKLHETMSQELKTLFRHRRHNSDTESARIPTEHLTICGFPLTRIDLRFYRCSNGQIETVDASGTNPPGTKPPGTNIPGTKPTMEAMPSKTCSSSDDILTCNSVSHCGAKQGYECCGFETYHPDFQTCCQQSSAKYQIFDNKPERNHVCCDLRVFRRHSSDVPCEQHVSFNDRFFQRPKNLKSLKNKYMCNLNKHKSQYLYRITIEVQRAVGVERYLEATVAVWPWDLNLRSSSKENMLDSPTSKGYMKIPLDKHSPFQKRLIGKSFFTITNEKYLEKAVFFLNSHDSLFKWPSRGKKLRKVSKLLRRLQKKC